MNGNFNATDTMYDWQTLDMQFRHWDYRWDSSRQAHYVTLNATDPRSVRCNVMFDRDWSVWEWYDDTKECAKVIAPGGPWGEGSLSPDWPTTANMTVDWGLETYTNNFTGRTATCHRFCRPPTCVGTNHTPSGIYEPCFCESPTPPYHIMKHTHMTRDDWTERGGVSFYEDYVETPELVGVAIKRPAYCPPADSSAVYPSNASGLERICRRCWAGSTGAPC